MTDDTHQGFSAVVCYGDEESVSQLVPHSKNSLLSGCPCTVLVMTKLAFMDSDLGATNPVFASSIQAWSGSITGGSRYCIGARVMLKVVHMHWYVEQDVVG